MNNNNHKISIATLNCRGLKKTNNPKKRQQFIRYLRSSGFDILVLQETHANDETTIQQFNLQFQTKSSTWNRQTGIIAINKKYKINPIEAGIDDGRFILADILHNNDINSSPVCTILNIYGRIGTATNKSNFFRELLDTDNIHQILHNPMKNIFIMGDFNYQSENLRADGTYTGTTLDWTTLLTDHYTDCFAENKAITWKSGTSATIIDYIYCSKPIRKSVNNITQQFISDTWTDHALLAINFTYERNSSKGPGAWKGNPFLASNKRFRSTLVQHLNESSKDLQVIASFATKQQQWDWIKLEVKAFTKGFQLAEINWRREQLVSLQRKRNGFLRQHKNRGLHLPILSVVEQQISALQESIAEIEILKAGKIWRENGERSPGLLKRISTSRESKRQINELMDPLDNCLYSEPSRLQQIAHAFYSNLYTPDNINTESLNCMLEQIPDNIRLTREQQEGLLTDIDFEDILLESKRSPKKSSPGSDGLPYEILRLIVQYPPYRDLITSIYNEALTLAIFPESWNESIMSLLPKKGNLADMKNYRPISLANTDYKIFTRLLNNKIKLISDGLINKHQLGFLQGRYIAENGMKCQIIMEDAALDMARASQLNQFPVNGKAIGLLLDQEKAYDRVNLIYLRTILLRFGFPATIVDCIYKLMANNYIRININGHFTEDIQKLRGLKQGDPLSPILYNLAFEPFLRSILTDELFHGYTLIDRSSGFVNPNLAINTKILCYADDALVLVKDKEDLERLSNHMDTFCEASNAKFNFDKIEAFSLSGDNVWDYWQQPLELLKIDKLICADDPDPIIYLGFPMIQSTQQRRNYMGSVISKLKATANLHLSRSLSVVGKATILNSLLLSKCWYLLRVTPLTKQDLSQITSVAIQFCRSNIFPVIPWSVWTTPKQMGGLGVLDPKAQYHTLFLRWTTPLLTDDDPNHQLTQMLKIHIRNRHSTQHHHIPLLLPTMRPTGLTKDRINTLDIIYATIDCIPRNFESTPLNHATALILPLQAIFQPPKIPKKASKLLVSDLFSYSPVLHCLHWKNPATFSNQWGNSPRMITNRLANGSIQLTPFFQPLCQPSQSEQTNNSAVDFYPWVQTLTIADKPISSTYPQRNKKYREAILQQHKSQLQYSLSRIPAKKWFLFWNLALVAVQRNVIYRLLTRSIPSRRYMHQIFPEKFNSAQCQICLSSIESSKHMLFYCPSKANIWKTIISEFLWPTTNIANIIAATFTLNFQPIAYCQKPGLTVQNVILCTLANIWKSHFRSSFDSTPFLWPVVVQQIRADLSSFQAEGSLQNLL